MNIEPITINDISAINNCNLQEVLCVAYNIIFSNTDLTNNNFDILSSKDLCDVNNIFMCSLNLISQDRNRHNPKVTIKNLATHPIQHILHVYPTSEFCRLFDICMALYEYDELHATPTRRKKLKATYKKRKSNAIADFPPSLLTPFRRNFKKKMGYTKEELYAANAFFLVQRAIKTLEQNDIEEYGNIMYSLAKIYNLLISNSKYIQGAKASHINRSKQKNESKQH